ncbi:condensation domain-containing protein [Kitasatospora mediocidica]|uniref:condensation domain-containing protein n=1 Tax=Kitasatospora mediocidica TaxID=58352 RepID=UPI00056916FF|nr:condensation domain-containing protein [Kitasatospora mediocidica]
MQLPLTAAQAEMWIAQVLDPLNPVYNVADYYEITGPVDAEILEKADRLAVDEAGSLGARFVTARRGAPAQILGRAEWTFRNVDMSAAPDPDAEALAWMRADLLELADIGTGPLLTSALLKLGENRYLWYRRMHHLIVDGYGCAAIARRTADLYTALLNGLPYDPNPFGSIAEAVEDDRAYPGSAAQEADREFWHAQLADWPATAAPTPAPTATASPAPSPAPAATTMNRMSPSRHLDAAACRALRERADKLETSPARLLITMTALFQRALTGSDEVAFGLPVTGRRTRRMKTVVAPMVGIVPLRVAFDPDASIEDAFQRVVAAFQQAMRHQRYRYEDVRRHLMDTQGRSDVGPLVNILNFDRSLTFGSSRGVVQTLATGPIDDIGYFFDVRPVEDLTSLCVEAAPARYTQQEAEDRAEALARFITAGVTLDSSAPLRDITA